MMTDDIIKMKAIVWEEKQVNKLTEKKAVKERRGLYIISGSTVIHMP